MTSNESLFVHINEFGIIISPDTITAELKTALHDSYEVLVYQILCEKPILCVCTPPIPRIPQSENPALPDESRHLASEILDVSGDSDAIATQSRNGPRYPTLYPGTLLVPEDCWQDFEAENYAILMNEVFILACLGKPSFEVTFKDLLTVFEILTDTEKLTNFGDEYGLIVGGVEWGHS